MTPFADDTNLVVTDKYGNELNITNDKDQLTIYGQWQGEVIAPEFVNFVEMLQHTQKILADNGITAHQEIKGISLKKKKNEVVLDVNVELIKDEDSSAKILQFTNKLAKI